MVLFNADLKGVDRKIKMKINMMPGIKTIVFFRFLCKKNENKKEKRLTNNPALEPLRREIPVKNNPPKREWRKGRKRKMRGMVAATM